MMKLINTFKDSLLKIGVVWKMFKMRVFNSGPVKAFAYVWGLDWINKLLISCYTILILICTVSGDWGSAVAIIGITYLVIGAEYYRSKYYELKEELHQMREVFAPIKTATGSAIDVLAGIPVKKDIEEVERCTDKKEHV